MAIDENRESNSLVVDTNAVIKNLLVDATTGRLLVDIISTEDSGSSVLNNPKIDENRENVSMGVTDDSNLKPTAFQIDSRNGYLYVDLLQE